MPARRKPMCYKHQQLLMAAFEQFCLLLESGLPMRNALQVTTAQTTDKLVRQVLIRFSQTVNQGLPLYRAAPELPAKIPVSFTGYLQLAEQSGQFVTVLNHMVDEFNHAHAQRQHIKAAVRYPLAILALSIVISVGLLVFVLPKFTALFGAGQLPLLTQKLLAFSLLLSNYGNMLLTACLLIALGAWLSRRYYRGIWQRSLLYLPVIGTLTEQARQQQMFQRLALLQRSGMAAVAAIKLCAQSSAWLKTRDDCNKLADLVADGNAWSVALDHIGLNHPLITAYISTGEQTGRIDFMMTKLAQQLSNDLRRRSQQLVGMIQPLLMLSLGGIIGVILLAMYLPIFTLGQQF